MKKRALSVFLVLVLALSLVPMAAFAEGTSTESGGENNGELILPEESVEEKTGAAAVQELIDALPDAASIDESNMEDVMAQLEAIDAAKDQLSDDEIASLDFTRYDAAAAVLTGDGTGVASTPMLVDTEATSVSTEGALLNAFANGGSIKLAADITITAAYGVNITSTLSLDLNGYAITGNGITVASGASLTISDSSAAGSGKINSNIYDDDNLVITGGTIQSLTVASSDVCTITGGTISDDLYNYGIFNAGGGTAKGYVQNMGTIKGYGAGETIFEGNVYNDGTISSGIFYTEIENDGAIIYSPSVTVEFIDSSGTIGTQQVPCGEKATPPTKTGYTAAYYMDSGCTKAFDVSSAIETTASTLNIYVTWTENSNYTVKYNTDGGSTVSDRTGVKWTDKVLNGVTNPTKNGYEFAGWTYSADGATTVVTGTTTYADLAKTDTVTGITLTATWTEKDSFTVAFDTDGGGTVSDKTGVKWTDKVLENIPDPTKNGYEFAGWTYMAEGATAVEVNGTTTYADLAKADTVASITLTATWSEKDSFTVAFDTDGGTAINDKTGVKWTDKVLNGVADPTKNGYEFAGWTYSADGATTVVTGTTTYADLAKTDTVTGIELTATWTEKNSFTVTFDTDGGTEINDKTSVKWTDKVLDDEIVSTRDGYELTGWKYGEVEVDENTTYADLAVEDTTESITLTAQWKDIIDPVISGIEDGKTYCEAQTVTVTDENIDTVTVNGETITLDENDQFTLTPADGEQTIVATDKDGNKAELTVTVNDGHTYGEWESNNNDTHSRYCTVEGCDAKETADCSGGTATCKDKAVCEVCSETYGEKDPSNHVNRRHFLAKAATTAEEGNIEYWYCDVCDKYFSDANAENEISLADTVIAKLAVTTTANQTGDSSHMILWTGLAAVCAGTVTAVTVSYKRRQSRR